MKQFLLPLVAVGGLLVVSLAIIEFAMDRESASVVAEATPAVPATRIGATPPVTPEPVRAETWVPVPAAEAVVSRTADGALTPATHRERISFRQEMVRGVASLGTLVAGCSLGGDATLLLDLESVRGGVTVLDARVEPGSAIPASRVECARSVLRGHIIEAPSAEPGRRWQMPFTPHR
jgi:hypothetical protein